MNNNMSEELYDISGIIAVLNTAFSEDGKTVMYDELEKHVEYALYSGVKGFLVPALAAEVYTLSKEERIQMVKTVLKTVNGRAKVIGCATAKTQEERLEAFSSLIELGCDVINVALEYDNDEQYRKNLREIASLNPKTLMVQDWSNGYGVPDNLIVELFNEIKAFKYYKIETVPANIKYSRIISLTNGKLAVGGGWAVSQMYNALERGVHMMMPTGMYEVYVKIYDLYKEGKFQESKQLFNDLLPVLAFSNQNLEISILYFKMMMKKQGIYTSDFYRTKTLAIDDAMINEIENLIEYTNELIKRARQI